MEVCPPGGKCAGASLSWHLEWRWLHGRSSARAQQSAPPLVGFMNNSTAKGSEDLKAAFLQGVSETGYIDGQNVTIEYHWAEGQPDRLLGVAGDLVRRRVSVIVATSTPAALAAKAATATIPIVFETAADPIKLGLVASLNRPGGNATGVAQFNAVLVAKRVGLLHDLIPSAKIIGMLVNPTELGIETQTKDVQKAAHALGLQIRILNASTEAEIDTAFAALPELRIEAFLVGTGEFFRRQSEQLTVLAARHRVPAIYQYREFAAADGLISYGTSLPDAYRLAGVYTGRVLKGEKPADLPVMQPIKFELVINLKTAKTLGLTIPPGVLAIANEVID